VAHAEMYTPPLLAFRNLLYSCGSGRHGMRFTRVKCGRERRGRAGVVAWGGARARAEGGSRARQTHSFNSVSLIWDDLITNPI
jgi:hypothetical protein